jgi:hypothetical protein
MRADPAIGAATLAALPPLTLVDNGARPFAIDGYAPAREEDLTFAKVSRGEPRRVSRKLTTGEKGVEYDWDHVGLPRTAGPPTRWSKSRTPEPRRSAAVTTLISSTRPAFMSCCGVRAVTPTDFPAAAALAWC